MATAEVEAIERFEAEWSAGARRARLERLRREQMEAAEEEARERARLAAEVNRLEAELEPLYEEAHAAMEAFVAAAERVMAARLAYEVAWRRARATGVEVAHLVPKASTRAAADRTGLLRLVHRLKAVNAADW